MLLRIISLTEEQGLQALVNDFLSKHEEYDIEIQYKITPDDSEYHRTYYAFIHYKPTRVEK